MSIHSGNLALQSEAKEAVSSFFHYQHQYNLFFVDRSENCLWQIYIESDDRDFNGIYEYLTIAVLEQQVKDVLKYIIKEKYIQNVHITRNLKM